MIDQAREIIADGCGCHRDCRNTGYCGCLVDAQAIFDVFQKAQAEPNRDRRKPCPTCGFRIVERKAEPFSFDAGSQ